MAAGVGAVTCSYLLTTACPCFFFPRTPVSDSAFCSPGDRARGRHRHPDSTAGKLNGMRRVEERRCCDLSQSRCATWSGSVRAVFVAATA